MTALITRAGREIYAAPDAAKKAEARLSALHGQGAKAWADLPDAAARVDEGRGGS